MARELTHSEMVGKASALAGILLLAATAQAQGPTAVVGRYTFYNNSFHDGYNPAIDPVPVVGDNNDDVDAIDPTKSPLLHGRGPATFANWTGCTNGITGLIYDYANVRSMPAPDAFSFFVVGKDGMAVPMPVSPENFVSSPVPGLEGSARVTITFPVGTVKNTWLQVIVDTSFGLPAADVHYWGNAAGDTGSTIGNAITVDQTDVDDIENHPWPVPLRGPIPVSWHWNLNKDGLLDVNDILLARSNFTTVFSAVQVIDKTEPADIIGRYVFYNQSFYDGNKSSIDPLPIPTTTEPPHEDDADAIDPTKSPLRPGDGAASFRSWTGYAKGLNGLVYDFAFANRDPVPADFAFHIVGRKGDIPVGPDSAVVPDQFRVQDLGGITRVILTFPNEAVANTWLQVDIGTGFGLPAPDVHYWGNVRYDCGTPSGIYIFVASTDEVGARNCPWLSASPRAPVTYRFDYNKDGFCNSTDAIGVRNHPANSTSDCVRIITR